MEHHYTDGTEPTIMPHIHCSGPCNQGRKPCPAPDACERVDVEYDGVEALGAVTVVIIALALLVIVLV